MARPAREISLSLKDRVTLKRWAHSRTIDNATATRARIILAAREGRAAADIAAGLGVSARNVYKWIWCFDKEGVEGLKERSRSGRPRKLALDGVMDILTKTIEDVPSGSTHWSQRLMAQAMVVTKQQVANIWAAAGLKPHRLRTFKISRAPRFAEKVVDVVWVCI